MRHESEVLITSIALVAMLAQAVPETAAHPSSAAMITIEDALTTGSPIPLSVQRVALKYAALPFGYKALVGKLSRLLWLVS